MQPPVRISDLALYLRCPRLIYFETMGHSAWPEAKNPANLLFREIALSLSDMEPGADLASWLEGALQKAESELPDIYRDQIDAGALGAAAEEVREAISEVAQNLAPKLGLIVPSEVEVELRSDRLGLSGRLDRLIFEDRGGEGRGDDESSGEEEEEEEEEEEGSQRGSALTPSIIRTGFAPERGVWRGDRLALAGYALLLEDSHDWRVDRGLVEYIRAGEVREVEIRSMDRRRVLRIRDRIRQIRDGKLPDRPKDAPCEQCPLAEMCESRRSLASKFF